MRFLKHLMTASAAVLSSLSLFAGYIKTVEFDAAGGTKSVIYDYGGSLQMTSKDKPSWVKCSQSIKTSKGTGTVTFTITAEKNTSASERSYTFTGVLDGKNLSLNVIQQGTSGEASCDLTVDGYHLCDANFEDVTAPTTEDELTFAPMFVNKGSKTVESATYRVLLDGRDVSGDYATLGPFKPFESFGAGINLGKLSAGNHTIVAEIDPENKVAESDETNNKATYVITVKGGSAPTPAAKKPNLMPFAFVINTDKDAEDSLEKYAEDDDLYVRFAVLNDGEEDAGPFKVNVYQDNEFLFSGEVPYLEANGFVPSPGFHIGKLKAGDHVFRMEVDVDGAVDESDEFDNVDDMTITVEESDVAVGKYTLYFNPNGGTCQQTTKICENHGKVGTLPVATCDGKYFWGWYLQDGRRVMSGTTVNTDDGAILTVYAKWGDTEFFTILFDANGGTCTMESKIYRQGDMVGNLPTATRSGYKFGGWWLEPPYYPEETQLLPTTWFTVDGDSPVFPVKARWELVETTSADLNFGPGYSSSFMVSKTEKAFLAGVGGATWGDFKVRSYDGYKCLVDKRVVDAEKTASGEVDGSWCGLFAEMNLCVWTGWSKYAGTTDEDEFAEYFRQNPSIGNSMAGEGKGCIETVLAQAGKSIQDYCSLLDTGTGFASALEESLADANCGLMLNLVYSDFEFEGVQYDAVLHSVNCYGYVLDTSKKASSPSRLKGLFIVESDNDKLNGDGGVSAPDTITYCPVKWNGSAYEISNVFGAVGVIESAASLRTESAQIEEQTKSKKVPSKNVNKPTTSDSGVGAKAGVYNGYVQDGDDVVAASVQLKVAKFDAAKGVSSVTATVKMLEKGKSYSLTGKMDAEGHAVLKTKKKDKCLTVDITKDSFSGSFDDLESFGGRNAFSDKDSEAAAKLADYKKTWSVVFSTEDVLDGDDVEFTGGYSYLTVTVGSKGAAKVAGVLADGTKVSLTSQLIFDDELGYAYVPIVAPLYSKAGGLAMIFQITDEGGAEITKATMWNGVYKKRPFTAELSVVEIVENPSVPEDAEGLAFYVDCYDLEDIDGYDVLFDFIPDGTAITFGKKGKWTLPKAGTVKYSRTEDDFVSSSDENAAGLKLSYKSGTFSGSFTVYVQVGDTKLRKYTATVYGVMSADGCGYGTAVIKGVGSFMVTLECM